MALLRWHVAMRSLGFAALAGVVRLVFGINTARGRWYIVWDVVGLLSNICSIFFAKCIQCLLDETTSVERLERREEKEGIPLDLIACQC